MIKYVAFDPGKQNTQGVGVATWDENIQCTEMAIYKGKEFDDFLDMLETQVPPPEVFIYEKYRVGFSLNGLQGKYARIHGGKDVPTEQCIGTILRTARKCGSRIVSQEPSILDVAQLHSGVRLPKNHSKSHGISAFNHGYEWLLRQHLIKPRVLGDR